MLLETLWDAFVCLPPHIQYNFMKFKCLVLILWSGQWRHWKHFKAKIVPQIFKTLWEIARQNLNPFKIQQFEGPFQDYFKVKNYRPLCLIVSNKWIIFLQKVNTLGKANSVLETWDTLLCGFSFWVSAAQ